MVEKRFPPTGLKGSQIVVLRQQLMTQSRHAAVQPDATEQVALLREIRDLLLAMQTTK